MTDSRHAKRRKVQHEDAKPGEAEEHAEEQPASDPSDRSDGPSDTSENSEEEADLLEALQAALPTIESKFKELSGGKSGFKSSKLKGTKLLKVLYFSWQQLGAEPIDCEEACVALKQAQPDAVSNGMTWQQLCDYMTDAVESLVATSQIEEMLATARQMERAGDNAGAREQLEAVLALAPGHLEALMALARVVHNGAACQQDMRLVEKHYRAAASAAMAADAAAREAGDEEGSAAAREAGKQALSKLGLLLCGEGREEQAAKVLKALGCRYRLAPGVLHYPLPGTTTAGAAPPSAGSADAAEAARYVAAYDGALPAPLLQHMQRALAPDGPFWREHSYDVEDSSYFSYVHELGSGQDDRPGGSSARSTLDLYIRHVRDVVSERFPAVSEARYAEWWAHCRPHPSGHQLHFDSENEGRGKVHNPICSTVMYLSEGTGGPTLVTTQPFGADRLAEKGWLVHPRINRLTAFDGRVLHGVVPGRGPSPQPGVRRVTLMVAFWRDFTVRPSPEGQPGPSRPFPLPGSSQVFTWNDRFDLAAAAAGAGGGGEGEAAAGGGAAGSKKWASKKAAAGKAAAGKGVAAAAAAAALGLAPAAGGSSRRLQPVVPQPVAPIWADVDAAANAAAGCAMASLTGLPDYQLCFQGF